MGGPRMLADPRKSRTLNLSDLLDLKIVSEPQLSHDGSRLAWVVADADNEEQKARKARKDDPGVADSDWRFARLWVVDAATREARCVTGERVHVWEYGWSPDGQRFVALVSDHPGDDAWYHAELVTVP